MDILSVVKEYLRFPGISADPAAKPAIDATADYLVGLLTKAGCKAERVETAGNPVVVGRYNADRDDLPHIVVYSHYDVQPVDPLELWQTPPFEPVIKDGKLYARGSADDRGPGAIPIVALANLLQKNPDLPLRVTFTIEGEEEIGSQHFPDFIKAHREELSSADFVVLSDTESIDKDQMAITVGLRGIIGLEIRLTGPNSDLHSGLHGGPVYNPCQALAEICASLHDAQNRVTVPGFYDGVGVPAAWEREELARIGENDEDYAKFLGVDALHCHPGYNAAECIRFLPTLEFNGIGGGYQGEGSKTIVPAKAFAKITCRLVPGMDPEDVFQKVAKAIRSRVPAGIRAEIVPMQKCKAYFVCPPGRENSDPMMNRALTNAFKAAEEIITQEFGKAPIYMRDGGAIGIINDFKEICKLDSLMLGVSLPDSRIHAPNENVVIDILEKNVKTYEAIFERCAKNPKSKA
ncbi:MAG: M20/M25/M40 family metallo-hydrolase [Opitutales bacterium]|nr:M20/M25/M40 family metallo-hydrolase [Opitutales bacterium]